MAARALMEAVLDLLESMLRSMRRWRWLNVAVIVLRILIAFAFLPAGLKKLLGEPFTDPENTGAFHEFLHAFHAAGFFYETVGVMQLLAAGLLVSQRFAFVGAVLAAPILFTILIFCWSTKVIPTATVVTLMSLGVTFLLLWDLPRWQTWFAREGDQLTIALPPAHPSIDMRLWTWCGWTVLGVFVANTVVTGNVYRPRGADWSDPQFWLLNLITLLPLVTFVIDYVKARRKPSQ